MAFTHVDCFAGPGGITTGFKAAGIETLIAIDYVQSCIDTFAANHPEVSMVHDDIRNVSIETLKKLLGAKSVDIVTAGMPCETFSTAGSKSRSFYDSRQTLFLEGIRIAAGLDAKVILLENVPAITTKKIAKDSDDLVVDLIYDALSSAGYKYFIDTILDSSDFGIPQNRKRFFILASKEKLALRSPISKHNGRVTVEDALAGLPLVKANEAALSDLRYNNTHSDYSTLMQDHKFWKIKAKPKTVTYHIPPKHRANTLKRFALIKAGEGLKDLFVKHTEQQVKRLQEEGILPNKWYIQRNRRLIAHKPSPTVTSHCLDEFLHPDIDRALTVREVARLQSFPDHYDFAGGPLICPHIAAEQDKYEQVGDAVPPLLAYHWGMTLRAILDEGRG